MKADLKTIAVDNQVVIYDVVADDGTVLTSGVRVNTTLDSEDTSIEDLEELVFNDLVANRATMKLTWQTSANIIVLEAMNTAWDETIEEDDD